MKEVKNEKKNKPYEVIRAGDVSLSIWENEGVSKDRKEYKFYTFQMQKSYKDGEDWKYTDSFNSNHFAKLLLVINKAMEKLLIKEKDEE